jgi:hypothetical protein
VARSGKPQLGRELGKGGETGAEVVVGNAVQLSRVMRNADSQYEGQQDDGKALEAHAGSRGRNG